MRFARILRYTLELLVLTALVSATRCANYPEVFVNGKIYFTDADCYARMTRVRLCAEHPGLVVRHHDFENYPEGTTPHTTAPLDYFILLLAWLLRPITFDAIDTAGAFCSPLLALLGGWFLWWWSIRMGFRYRWALLLLYSLSPMLVHATELGRPDHQSLTTILVTIALCAEWIFAREAKGRWAVVAGGAWALAIWVSAYEPLLLFILFTVVLFVRQGRAAFGAPRRSAWIVFGAIVLLALVIERRLPTPPAISNPLQNNWSRTIAELRPVGLLNANWLRWAGDLILAAPVLIWSTYRKKEPLPWFMIVLLIVTFCLTMWQARWGYFFISVFAIALPHLLQSLRPAALVIAAFSVCLLPILRDWDERFWPNELELGRRAEQRQQAMDLRALSAELMSAQRHPFLAPWWLSPAVTYWSGQPAVAGSSHESLPGILESARFFVAADSRQALEIITQHQVAWVLAYDADRVTANSAALLGRPAAPDGLAAFLDRTPSQAPHFLTLLSQNQTIKLFRIGNNR